MDNPLEKINQRLSNIEGFLVKIDKQGNQVPTIGTTRSPWPLCEQRRTTKVVRECLGLTL